MTAHESHADTARLNQLVTWAAFAATADDPEQRDAENAAGLVLALVAEVRRLRATLQDIADHGLRADLNPTVSSAMDGGGTYRELTAYLRRLDSTLRERARRALDLDGGGATGDQH